MTLAAAWIFGLCIAAHVEAQTAADKAAAEALFDRGIELMKEGKYHEACERLEQSQAVERGIGTMLYLAECYEKIGKSASAWALFREAASTAQAAGQAERAEAGRTRAAKLEKSLSRLTIHVPQANRVPGLLVQDNGSALQAAVWGVALPIDPGIHRVAASAPGYVAWASDVRIDDRGASAEVHVPALVKDPNAVVAALTPSANEGSAAAATAARPTEPAAKPQGMTTMRITGVALGAAGVLSIGVGAIVGGLAIKNKNDYQDSKREEGLCNTKCASASKDAVKQANVATAMWAVGGALLVGGLVTYFLAPKYPRQADVALNFDHKSAALRVGGVF